MHTCRLVLITHVSLSVLIGMLCLVSDFGEARFLWLFATALLVSVFGYRLASDWGLSGLTGLACSCGLFLLFVTQGWMKMYSWLANGDNLLPVLAGTALLSGTLLMVKKAKFFALMKLISVIGPVTMGSVSLAVNLPDYSSSLGLREDSSVQGSPLTSSEAGSNLSPARVLKEAVSNNSGKMVPLSVDSQVYSRKNGGFVESRVAVVGPRAAPTISGVDPDSMGAAGVINISISGANFQQGATVTFENGSGPAPVAAVTNVTGSEITATLVGVGYGGSEEARKWDVRVTNPDQGTAVRSAGLSVIKFF